MSIPYLVKDIFPGLGSSDPSRLTAVGNTLYFYANGDGNPYGFAELWKSDGTAEGTVLVKDNDEIDRAGVVMVDIWAGAELVGNTLYAGRRTSRSWELLKRDVEPGAGYVLVKEIVFPGIVTYEPRQLTAVGDTLYFYAEGEHGDSRMWRLWKSDGTAEGTVRVGDAIEPLYITAVGNTLYFNAWDPVNGRELWKSDGTAEGTVLVKDIYPGFGSSGPHNLRVVGDTLYFGVRTFYGYDTWKSDGTAAGTVPSPVGFPVLVGDTLFFTSGGGLWKSDITGAGAVLVKGFSSRIMGNFTAVGDNVYFLAETGDDDNNPLELWKSDGTAEGTFPVKLPGSNSLRFSYSSPPYLTAVGNTLFFVAYNNVIGTELWAVNNSPSSDDPHELLEIFAKDTVYQNWQVGQDADLAIYPDSGYFVDRVFNDLSTGFYGIGLVNVDASLAPILVLRGTEFTGYGDILADLSADSIGYEQFISNFGELSVWLDQNNNNITSPYITGHSLGGALAQLIAANYTGNLGEVVTFNSPGISSQEANKFNSSKTEGVTHYIQIGDLVSMAGEKFIDGEVKQYNYDNFVSAINFDKHTVPMLADKISNSSKPVYSYFNTITSAELSNESFSYYDYIPLFDNDYFYIHNDYFYLQLIVYGINHQLGLDLTQRDTTENSRQAIANTVQTAFTTLQDTGRLELPDLNFTIGNSFNSKNLISLGNNANNAIFALQSEDVFLRSFQNTPDYLLINGTLTASTSLFRGISGVSDNLRVSADFADPYIDLLEPDKYIKITPTEVDIVGDFKVENFLIGSFGIEELVIELDTVVDSIKGDLQLKLPLEFSIEAGAGWIQDPQTQEWGLNYIAAGVDDVNKSIPAYPIVFFQGINGSLENFNENATEPLTFALNTKFTIGPKIDNLYLGLPFYLGGGSDFALIEFEVGGELSAESLIADGKIEILAGIIQGTGQVELNWKNKYTQGVINANALGGVISLNGGYKINSNADINILGTGSLAIPKINIGNVFGLGGVTLTSASNHLQFTNDSNFSNDYIASWGEVFLLGEVGLKVNFDGSYGIIGAKEIKDISSGLGIQPFAIASFSILENNIQPFSVNTSIEETFPVSAQLPWIAFVANWENAADAQIELIDPNGTVYTEADIALSETINVIDRLTTDTSKVIHVANPQLGNWSIRVVNGDSLGIVEFSSFTEANPPTLAINTIESDGNGNFIINYEVGNTGGDQTQYTFYVDDNQEGFDGLIIGNGIKINEGTGSFIWDGDGIALGEYYVYGVITSDNTIPAFSNYSAQTIAIANVNRTPRVTDISKNGDEDTAIAFTLANFTSAFSDPDNDSLIRIQIVTLPHNGILKLNGEAVTEGQEIEATDLGHLSFEPNTNFNGHVSFSWNGYDGTVYAVNPAQINLTINPVNDAPTLEKAIAVWSAIEGQPFTFAIPVHTFADVDGDILTYSLAAGTVLPDGITFDPATRSFSGTPSDTASGSYNLTVIASDPDGEIASDTFTLQVFHPIPVSSGGGIISGTNQDDLIDASGKLGTYRLQGGGGNDLLIGSHQRDVLQGGLDNDRLYGGGDIDRLFGEEGDDLLDGGAGSDFLYGGLGADYFVLATGNGSDRIMDFNPAEGDRLALSGLNFGQLSFNSNQIILGSEVLAYVTGSLGNPVTGLNTRPEWFVTL